MLVCRQRIAYGVAQGENGVDCTHEEWKPVLCPRTPPKKRGATRGGGALSDGIVQLQMNRRLIDRRMHGDPRMIEAVIDV